jgi:hypothetical protein
MAKEKQTAGAILNEMDACPVAHLARIMKHPNTPIELQVACGKALLPFVHRRLADFEVTVEGSAIPSPHTTVNILQIMTNPAARRAVEQLEAELQRSEIERRAIASAPQRRAIEPARIFDINKES